MVSHPAPRRARPKVNFGARPQARPRSLNFRNEQFITTSQAQIPAYAARSRRTVPLPPPPPPFPPRGASLCTVSTVTVQGKICRQPTRGTRGDFMWRPARSPVRRVLLLLLGFVLGRYTARYSVNVKLETAPAPGDATETSQHYRIRRKKNRQVDISLPPPSPQQQNRQLPWPTRRVRLRPPPPSSSSPPPPPPGAVPGGRSYRDFPDRNERREFEKSPEGLAARLKASRDELEFTIWTHDLLATCSTRGGFCQRTRFR